MQVLNAMFFKLTLLTKVVYDKATIVSRTALLCKTSLRSVLGTFRSVTAHSLLFEKQSYTAATKYTGHYGCC